MFIMLWIKKIPFLTLVVDKTLSKEKMRIVVYKTCNINRQDVHFEKHIATQQTRYVIVNLKIIVLPTK